jgi:hypothetical protein
MPTFSCVLCGSPLVESSNRSESFFFYSEARDRNANEREK